MKSPRIAPPAPTSLSLRLASSLALFGFAAVAGACKMSPAMEARNQAARAGGPPAPVAVPIGAPVAAPIASPLPPPPPSPTTSASPPAHRVAMPTPLPPTAPPGALKSADRGERTLGPTPIGQMAPEEAPPVPTGR